MSTYKNFEEWWEKEGRVKSAWVQNSTKARAELTWSARDADIAAKEKLIEQLKADNDELNATFDLMHAAQQRATQLWRKQDPDGRKLRLPDVADLFIWTWQELEQLEKLKAAIVIKDEALQMVAKYRAQIRVFSTPELEQLDKALSTNPETLGMRGGV